MTGGRAGDAIDWRPRSIRWFAPLCVYAVAACGACELAQRSPWGLVWLALVGCAGCFEGWHAYREALTHHTMWLSDGSIEVDATGRGATVGRIERAWLGPFATAVWLRTTSARRLLVVYRVEMSSASYAALRRHLKLWAPRAPFRF